MRSSSVKTLTVAVTLTLALAAATPAAAATPRKSGRAETTARATRGGDRDSSIVRQIERIIQKLFSLTTQDTMIPPIPATTR